MNKIMTENVKSMGIMLTEVMSNMSNTKKGKITTINESNIISNVAANTTEIFEAIEKCELRKEILLDLIEKSSNGDDIEKNNIYISI